MIKVGFCFKFEIPDTWSEIREGKHYIYHGQNQEELIVSGAIVEGKGSSSDLSEIRKQLFQSAINSANKAAIHPDLKIIQAFSRNADTPTPCWTLFSKTIDDSIIFSEAVFISTLAVLLVTFEAPNTHVSKLFFDEFLKKVEYNS